MAATYDASHKLAIYIDDPTTPNAQQFRRMVQIGMISAALDVAGESQIGTMQAVVSITQANPAVVEATAHNIAAGQQVIMQNIAGMTELEGAVAQIGSVTVNTFVLLGIDSTSYGVYTGGGITAHRFTLEQWQKRADLAANILGTQFSGDPPVAKAGSEIWLDAFALAVAHNPSITATTVTSEDDGSVKFTVNSVFDDIARVSGQNLT